MEDHIIWLHIMKNLYTILSSIIYIDILTIQGETTKREAVIGAKPPGSVFFRVDLPKRTPKDPKEHKKEPKRNQKDSKGHDKFSE